MMISLFWINFGDFQKNLMRHVGCELDLRLTSFLKREYPFFFFHSFCTRKNDSPMYGNTSLCAETARVDTPVVGITSLLVPSGHESQGHLS